MNSPEGASGYAERHRSDMYNDQDPLALSKDVSGILGSMFDNEPQQHPSSGLPNGYGAEEFSGRESGFPGGPHGISRPPGIAGMGQSSFGTNTPPPGIAAPAHRQGALGMQMGGAGDSQQQQHPQLNGSAAWFAELQQQSQARGQYGAQGSPAVEHRQNGPAGAYSGVNGHAGGSDPLLAQIMAAASGSNGQRGGYGQQPRDAYGSHGSSGNGNGEC